MKIYKNGILWLEITSPNELLGMYQTIANNLRNNYFTNVETMSLIASSRSVYQVDTMPETPAINTIYYVGTEAPYDVKLVDSNGTIVDLGSSDTPMSEYFKTAEFDGETITYNGTIKKASSNAIIDVNGLPESNINENVYYRDQSDENKIKYYNNNQWNDLGSGGGARLYRHSIKWGNSSDANSYLVFYFDTTRATPYNTASEIGVAMNELGLNSRNPISAYNHVNDVPGLIYTIYVLENGKLYYKNGPTASSYVVTLWNFLDDIVTPLYTISAGETEGYRETRETITTSTYGSTGQGSSSGVQIPLTKGISNFDYIEIYAQTADNNQNHRTFRIEAQDLMDYYSQSKAYSMDINDTTQSRRWGLLWEENDTTLRLYYSNFKINKIVGVSTKPIVVGDKPYKQLFVSATGTTSTITLNDDITKFTYLEVFSRRSEYIISTKIPVARIINQNYKPLDNMAWENGNFWVFIARSGTSTTQFTVNNQGSNGVIEVIGWY